MMGQKYVITLSQLLHHVMRYSQAHYKRLVTLVDAARLGYNDRISGLSEQFNLSHESDAESEDIGQVKYSDIAETAQEYSDITETSQEYSDIVETINTGCSLNIGASEFIPQTLNANAAVFTPSL